MSNSSEAAHSCTPLAPALSSGTGRTLWQMCREAHQCACRDPGPEGSSGAGTQAPPPPSTGPSLCPSSIGGAQSAQGLAKGVPEACREHSWAVRWAEMGAVAQDSRSAKFCPQPRRSRFGHRCARPPWAWSRPLSAVRGWIRPRTRQTPQCPPCPGSNPVAAA